MGLQINETNKHFEIRVVPYNEEIVEAVKTIKGRYYRGQDKTWVIPRYMENAVLSLKRQFGIRETIDPVLSMPEQVGILDPLPELEIELNLLRPLFPFQPSEVAQGMIWKRFIIGSEMGTAKTATSIATAVALKSKCILVICPNVAKYNWQLEYKVMTGKPAMILGDDKNVRWDLYYKNGMVNMFIVNYEGLSKFFVKPGWVRKKGVLRTRDIPFHERVNLFDCVIIDESHSLSNAESLQSNLSKGICEGKPVQMLLTGTMLVNSIRDVANQLAVIGRLKDIVSHIPQPVDEYGRHTDHEGYARFYNRYCNGENGESNLNELKYRLRKICYFRRLKSEVAKDLPEKMRHLVYCDITNRDEYKECEKKFVDYLKEIKNSDTPNKKMLLAGQMMVRLGKLRQIAAAGKIKAVKEYTDQVLSNGKKVVIFAHHQHVIDLLKQTYPNAVTITGKDSNEHRDRSVKAFQNDPKVKEVICSIKVAAETITLTAASDVVAVELPLTNAKLEQMIDRCHRIGQKEPVTGAMMLGHKTVDVYVYFKIIMKKKDLFDRVAEVDVKEIDSTITELIEFIEDKKAA